MLHVKGFNVLITSPSTQLWSRQLTSKSVWRTLPVSGEKFVVVLRVWREAEVSIHFRRRGVHFQLFWVVITRYEVGLQRLCPFLKFGGFIQWILCLLHFQLLEGSIFEESNSTAMRAIGTARPSFFVTSWFCNFPTRSRRRFCTIIFAMWIPAHLVLYCAFFYLLVR